MYQLQIIATSLEDAIEAQAGGASNLEVTVNLAFGGVSPPLHILEMIREAVMLDLHVMVRPHARSFVYSHADIETIFAEVAQFKAAGANGIVFGALKPDFTLDNDLIRKVAEASKPLAFTLHRAIDESQNPDSSILSLRDSIDRILTSGTTKNAWEGRRLIRRWVEAHGEHIDFVCGGDVNTGNIAALAAFTGAPEYHVGSAARTNNVVDRAKVRQLVQHLNKE